MNKYLLIFGVSLFSANIYAENVEFSKNELNNCVIQAAIAGKKMTGAFFDLKHEGSEQSIVKAEIPQLSDRVELHEMSMDDHVMTMKKIESYSLKSGVNQFQKGGYHLMIFDLKEAPELSKTYTITLKFNDGSKVECEASVKKPEDLMRHH